MPSTILVVEDAALLAMDLVMALEDAGYAVVGVAATKQAALALAEAHPIDLATMDVELAHGSNGIDTAIELRERFSIPSLFVSGSLGKEIMEKAAPAEPVGFLNKPISSDDVLRAVERYLGGGDLPNVR
ncbi:response regulator [Haematobacter massiliensis]|uniref:Regulator n=3 Tax=Haematobacter TaxID=366614 RepID=A0A086XUH1_9RHOB|nr:MULTISPECIES: response regulator [Haematobacter]KFI25671.1 regulator [Haematobacter massiliensis]OWJ69611.1 response regulator [Haematobacter massiliensis]OWJ74432.1 response regulator [Haematobacter genomosp. 1]OWJ83084.1 response regulator [Haematobacter massiliensis]QBJ23065.1 response regulator [Haematobacter massiliensis]